MIWTVIGKIGDGGFRLCFPVSKRGLFRDNECLVRDLNVRRFDAALNTNGTYFLSPPLLT